MSENASQPQIIFRGRGRGRLVVKNEVVEDSNTFLGRGRLLKQTTPIHEWSEMKQENPEELNNIFRGYCTGIDFLKYQKIPVNVEKNNDQNYVPLKNFSDLHELHPIVANSVRLSKYDVPTPIQKHAVPCALKEYDIMACAQTGSGKTAAFLLPIVNQMLIKGPGEILQLSKESRSCQFPQALILAPTRELAIQINEEACKFTYRSHVKSVVVYGGQNKYEQRMKLISGCHILVATPGRLIDFSEEGRISLSQIKYLVLDEADRMLDMGFEPQIRRIINEFKMPPFYQRQTLMFSATFPREIQKLAADFMKQYVFITVGRVGSSSESLTQTIKYVEDYQKTDTLIEIINQRESPSDLMLVFVETKRDANNLANLLSRQSFPSTSIHGDRTQFEREHALRTFRSGKTPILVATSVAARGLDIPNVKYVVNYDFPSVFEDYVHRIGRAGRLGHLGQAISFINEKNRFVSTALVKNLREANQEVPDWLIKFSVGHNISRPDEYAFGLGDWN